MWSIDPGSEGVETASTGLGPNLPKSWAASMSGDVHSGHGEQPINDPVAGDAARNDSGLS